MVQDGLQEAFRMAFGDRFWKCLGRIWMRLGRIWAFKIKAFASRGHFLNTLGVPCCLTLRYKNPRAASLRLAERHNLKNFCKNYGRHWILRSWYYGECIRSKPKFTATSTVSSNLAFSCALILMIASCSLRDSVMYDLSLPTSDVPLVVVHFQE